MLFSGADVALLGLGDAASTLATARRRRAPAVRTQRPPADCHVAISELSVGSEGVGGTAR